MEDTSAQQAVHEELSRVTCYPAKLSEFSLGFLWERATASRAEAPRFADWLSGVVAQEISRRKTAGNPIEATRPSLGLHEWTNDEIGDALIFVHVVLRHEIRADAAEFLRSAHERIILYAVGRLKES